MSKEIDVIGRLAAMAFMHGEDWEKVHDAVADLIYVAEQMRIDMNITRSNVMAEISKGRDRWDGVPEILEYRISKFDDALSRVRGEQ